VEPTASAERARQHTLFLMDGLCTAPSPVLLVVADVATAVRFALAVHSGSARWDDRPARSGRLLELDLARIAAGPAGDFTELLAELAGTDHWVYLPDVDSMVESPAGRRFLDELMDSVGGGEIAAVIASSTRDQLPKVQAEAPRLLGFASLLRGPDDAEPGGLTYTRSIVLRSADPTDLGWVISVRYELTGAIRADAATADISTDGRLQLVDTISMVGGDGEPPLGVVISLTPDAFTVSQEDAAFATAELAAERLVGRRLGREEHVTAARGIFYA